MNSIEGTVIFAQESRFQLLDGDGVGHHFVLSHSSAADPEQLPMLQRNQARVRVHFRVANDLLANEAVDIDMLQDCAR